MAWTSTKPSWAVNKAARASFYDKLWDSIQYNRELSTGDHTAIVVAAGSDGSAATPFLKRHADGTGLFFGTGYTAFSAAGTEVMRVASTVGLFTSADPQTGLYVTPSSLTGTAQAGLKVDITANQAATVWGAALHARLRTVATAFTMASAYGIYVGATILGAGSTITTNYGLYLANQTVGGTNWGVYAESPMKNYFGGNVGIGTTTNINAALTLAAGSVIALNTADGNDNGTLYISGGGASGVTRGAHIILGGAQGGGSLFLSSAYDEPNSTSIATQFKLVQGGAAPGSNLGGAILGSDALMPAPMGAGTLNVYGTIYKNGTAYANPDYVFEHFFTSRIEKFRANPGAEKYDGLWPLEKLEAYVAEKWRLPGITDDPTGIFEMADIALEKIEQLFLYSFAAHKRIKVLEAMLNGGNN